jgi:hypothetical protein
MKVYKRNCIELFTLSFGKTINEYLIAATSAENGNHVNNFLRLSIVVWAKALAVLMAHNGRVYE